MKKSIILLCVLFLMAVTAMLLLQGCSKEDTLLPSEFAPPSNLRALSQSGAVILYWTRSSSDGSSDFLGYRIITDSLNGRRIDSVFRTTDTTRITGLVNGGSYKFRIWSVKDNGDVSIADSIIWGPTIRHGSARIYELPSAYPNPSGFAFSNGTAYTMTSGQSGRPDNRPFVDIYLDSVTTTELFIRSASLVPSSNTGWRVTSLYTTSVSSLDAQVDFVPGSFSSTVPLVVVANKVYLAYTTEGHYARFQVTAIGGTPPNRYIDIVTTFNDDFGVWAKK